MPSEQETLEAISGWGGPVAAAEATRIVGDSEIAAFEVRLRDLQARGLMVFREGGWKRREEDEGMVITRWRDKSAFDSWVQSDESRNLMVGSAIVDCCEDIPRWALTRSQ